MSLDIWQLLLDGRWLYLTTVASCAGETIAKLVSAPLVHINSVDHGLGETSTKIIDFVMEAT